MFLVGLFFFVRRFRTSRFDYLYNDNIIHPSKEEERIPLRPFSGYNYDNSNVNQATNDNSTRVQGTPVKTSDEIPLVTTATINTAQQPSPQPVVNNPQNNIPTTNTPTSNIPTMNMPVNNIPTNNINNNINPNGNIN